MSERDMDGCQSTTEISHWIVPTSPSISFFWISLMWEKIEREWMNFFRKSPLQLFGDQNDKIPETIGMTVGLFVQCNHITNDDDDDQLHYSNQDWMNWIWNWLFFGKKWLSHHHWLLLSLLWWWYWIEFDLNWILNQSINRWMNFKTKTEYIQYAEINAQNQIRNRLKPRQNVRLYSIFPLRKEKNRSNIENETKTSQERIMNLSFWKLCIQKSWTKTKKKWIHSNRSILIAQTFSSWDWLIEEKYEFFRKQIANFISSFKQTHEPKSQPRFFRIDYY